MSENAYTTNNYISRFDFAYLETYSFCRGNEYDDEGRSYPYEYILSDKGVLHSSAVLTHRLAKDSLQAQKLMQILSADTLPIAVPGCAPVYRDAVIFYNSDGSVVSSLNICLSCCYMQDSTEKHVMADFPVYNKLKLFFLEMGHAIESPSLFPEAPNPDNLR